MNGFRLLRRAKLPGGNLGLLKKPSRKPSPRPVKAARKQSVWLKPLRFIARILSSDVRLERDGKNLHLRVSAKPDVQLDDVLEQSIADAAAMRTALKALLDSHRMTRRVMRHLGYFERALGTHGMRAMSQVPLEVLDASLKQLESLVGNWSDPRLADLRSKMAVALIDRSADPFYGAPGDRLSNFATESRLAVEDVSHSLFIELERQYQGLVAPEAIEASLAEAKSAV